MASNGQLLAHRNYYGTTGYGSPPPFDTSRPKLKPAERELADFTLLEALDRDDRPTFAVETRSSLGHDEAHTIELVYANTALHTVGGLMTKITGDESTSLFAQSSGPQLAFRNWIRGQGIEEELQQHGNTYTFEGHVWNATSVGRYKIVSGVPTRLLWVDAAPGGKSHRTLRRERKTPWPGSKHRADALPIKPQLSLAQIPQTPEADTSSSADRSAAPHASFDCTSDVLTSTSPHIEYFRSVDWANTPLGPMSSWPSDLRCVANTVLSNNVPAVMFWGDDVIMLYNEPYVQLLGSLHPCMGESVRVTAPDHWVSFQPLVDYIKSTGESIAEPDMLLFIDRDKILEETHWSFQFVPILNTDGQVAAYYQSFYEVSNHRILERRVSSLVAMGTQSANARDFPSFWETTLRSLSLNDKDVPFALLYAAERHVSAQIPSVSSPGSIPPLEGCVLKGTIGVSADHSIAPATININEDSYILQPFLSRAAKSGKATVVHVEDLPDPTRALQGIDWKGYGDPCRTLVICPIIPTTGNQVEGFLIIGINPRRPFDEEYQQYLHVMVRLLATSLASIVLFEDEVRQRENAIIQAAQIQEHLMAEIQLKESKFQRFAERSDVGIFIIDPAGTYTYRNQRWHDIFEIASSDDNATVAWHKIAFEEDISYCQSMFAKLIMNHESVIFELRTRMPWTPPSQSDEPQTEDTQHYKWILCSAFPELGPNGDLVEVVGNVTDISKQKWAEGIQKIRMDSALQGKQHLEHFLDTTSHEMRNPLSAIMQCADSITSSYPQEDYQERQNTTPNEWTAFIESTLDAAQTIGVCASHMKHIVDDILTISKLDSGLLDMTPVIAQPESVVMHAVKMFDAEARAAGINLVLNVDQSYRNMEIDWASLDPTRVLQILINLLTNAIKFTRLESTKRVTVTLAASSAEPVSTLHGIQYNEERLVGQDPHLEEDWKKAQELFYIQFAVTDTGRGLSDEEKCNLFTRFSQASPRTHIHYGGSGLGLFISRRLTELQGGSIGVASESGRGSTFAFYIKSRRARPIVARKGSLPHVFPEEIKHRRPIPLVSLTRPSPPVRISTGEQGQRSDSASPKARRPSVQSKSSQTEHSHVRPEALGLPEGPDLQELKRTKSIPDTLHVLVVEDNLINQRVLAKQLRNLGCVVSVANHGQEALDFLPKTSLWKHDQATGDAIAQEALHNGELPIELSLILMDWEMPIMNGLTAVAEIRKLEQQGLLKERVPIIGVTANVRQQQIEQAMAAGMDDVVEYGPIVRTAPDEVHVSDPSAIPILYPTQQPLEKTDWYLTYRAVNLGPSPDLFTDDNEKHHAAHRRTVGSVYTLSSILKNERAVDELMTLFGKRLGRFADREEDVDFGLWLEMFSFDSVGAVFFGQPFGFLETSSDYGNYIAAVHTAMPMSSVIAMAPLWCRGYLLQIGVMIPKVFKAIMAVDGIGQTAVRETGIAQEKRAEANTHRTDVLSQLLGIMREKGGSLSIEKIHVEMWAAVIAGSDSTSGALRAIFYFLMKHPPKMERLTQEIDAAFQNSTLTSPVQYNQATKLPYLMAVIQESLRLFPPFGVSMPRYVPNGGLHLFSYHIPAGFKIGMNAMVTQFDESVFGEDAREFRPERWLVNDESYAGVWRGY
ncbi:uncharacterized protein J4E87_001580 [Alternaria ethzedia]|uniref:uncharacterized protein n=1 Tax=Alternaria ethzedia TaxID=181014 RepID=UPI0020C2D316|nr:uncharacterized protein J4E87_001580 [Alternaria ethzedia]KAI4632109.1 hypothetical protein J4E87_001580 [Alternaria ethzedia]